MHFDLTDDQREIKRTARALLADRCSPADVRAAAESRRYDELLWAELVTLGWPAIAIAEEHGGLGLGAVEAMCLAEELGYAVAGAPLLSTMAAALLLSAAGSAEQQSAWLGRLARGEATGSVGMVDQGLARLVPDGAAADVIVLVEDGVARLVEAGDADVRTIETIDPTRRYAEVAGDGPRLPGDPAAGLARAAVLVAAELVGICQRALDLTVAYVSERRQFGRPIGAFQAVAHRCAEMLLDTESARSAVYHAAWACDASQEDLPVAAAIAKATASEAGRSVTASAVQAHGGIGFTWEADVHWLLKRAQLDALLFGTAGEHRVALVDTIARRRAAARG
jgi:alkylation response protein AidB-like acyl-CoA dehydrogenase